MNTPEYTWESHECEECGDYATHELWFGGELLHRYCGACMSLKDIEIMRFWHDIAQAAEDAPVRVD